MLAVRASPTLGPGPLRWDSKSSPFLAAARLRGPTEVSQTTSPAPPHTYTLTHAKQGPSLEVDSPWGHCAERGVPAAIDIGPCFEGGRDEGLQETRGGTDEHKDPD